MMQAAVIIMTVMGCGDQMMSCDMIPNTQTKWQSQAQCAAAIPAALRGIKIQSYPTITVTCEAQATPQQASQPPQPLVNVDYTNHVDRVEEDTLPAIAVLKFKPSFDQLQAKAASYEPQLLVKTGAFFTRAIDQTKAQLSKLKAPFQKQQTTY